MAKAKRYYNLAVNGKVADLDIYGDIVKESFYNDESDMGAYRLSKKLAALGDVTQINVNINSYGGEVAEGIAIYNALVRHSAKVVTRCDGMACSIASVIFMAGSERIMYAPSMLMIHNASSGAWGTAAALRKAADDAEKLTTMSKAAYMQCVNITEEELTALMDAETWISPSEALDMGFATSIEAREGTNAPAQDARVSAFAMIEDACHSMALDPDDDPDDGPDDDDIVPDPDDDDIEPDHDDDDPDEDDPNRADPKQDDANEEDPDEGDKKDEQAWRSFVMAAYGA